MEDASEWDRVEINGYIFEETKVDIDGDGFGNDFDVQKAAGADGATLNNKGVEPIKPSVKWLIYNEFHWTAYQALVEEIYPYPGKTPLPLVKVVHPQLVLLKKEKFRLARIHPLKPTGNQIMEARLDLVEFFEKAKKAQPPSTTGAATRTRQAAIRELETNKPSNNTNPVPDVVRPLK
jgi:hypothetical protein